MTNGPRLLSIDTLRGMDMLLIRGLGPLLMAICLLFPNGSQSWLSLQLHHAQWDGMRIYDMIFPLFLFISGLSFPFSLAKQQENNLSKKQQCIRIIRRGISLFLMGLVFNGFLQFEFQNFRLWSVLGRIGLAWTMASLLYVNFSRRTFTTRSVSDADSRERYPGKNHTFPIPRRPGFLRPGKQIFEPFRVIRHRRLAIS